MRVNRYRSKLCIEAKYIIQSTDVDDSSDVRSLAVPYSREKGPKILVDEWEEKCGSIPPN